MSKSTMSFGKRFLIFLLGFIIGILALAGTVVGVGFWAYKNFSLKTLESFGVSVGGSVKEDSALKTLPIEGWIKEIGNIASGANNTSISELEMRYGINLPASVRDMLPEAALDIPLARLITASGIDTVLSQTKGDYLIKLAGEGSLPAFVEKMIRNHSLATLVSFDMNVLTDGVYVGDVMGYTEVTAQNTAISTVAGSLKWKDASGAELDVIMNALANQPLSTMLNGSFSIEAVFASIYVGDLMGYEKGEALTDGQEGYCWYTRGSNGCAQVTGVGAQLSNIAVTTLLDGTFDADDMISEISLGEILTFDENTPGVIKAIGAETKIGELSDKTLSLFVGEIIGLHRVQAMDNEGFPMVDDNDAPIYVKDADGYEIWYDDLNEVATGIMSKFSTLTVADLSDGTVVQSVVNVMTLGDVVEIDDDVSIILRELKDVKVGEISVKMNEMPMGKIMGLHQKNDQWYSDKDGTIPADTLAVSFADLRIRQLTPANIETKVKNVKVDALFDTSSGIFILLQDENGDMNITVSQLPSRLSQAMQSATMGKMIEAGVFDTASESDLNQISAAIYKGTPNAAECWKTKSVSELFADMATYITAASEITGA